MRREGRPGTGEVHYPPRVLREYALLADGERGAVVGPQGDITWMCVPRWDSASVFGELMGAGGVYAVTPRDRFVWGGYYEAASLIWRNRWVTEAGIVECRDALVFPGDAHRAVLLRRIEPLDGDAALEFVLEPRAEYGSEPVRRAKLHNGVWTAEVGKLRLRWGGAADSRLVDGSWRGELYVPHGGRHDLVLEISDEPLPDELPSPDRLWEATAAEWDEHVPRIDNCLTPADARRSYAVMRSLTSAGGGMVAAATAGLPERADTGRSYDYRYVWIRDQCFAGQAVAAAGPHALLDDAVRFVSERLLEHGDRLMPAYTTAGEPIPDQRHLGVPGYPGGTDIVGNHVNKQFQLDMFGEALLLFAAASRHDHLDSAAWRAAELSADAIAKRWTEPDAGIWELEPARWTHSRLICAAGLRAMAAARPLATRSSERIALADRLVADASAHALAGEGYWRRAPDDERVDAALLLPGLRGAVPEDDPRTTATLRAYLRDLTHQGYAYRYRPDERPLGEAEGAFQLCGFLTAMALDQQGEHFEAGRWFERTRAACGPPQLFSEEYDATENQMRGNLPQAFVHAYLLEASVRLNR
jgi:GH15 family glucan-1,4-alpha-glucosidase